MSNPTPVSLNGSGTVPRPVGRSAWAIFAGFVVVVILSLGTDEVLHLLRVYPPWSQRMPDGLFVWATIYRTIYAIFGSYLTARLAPNRPVWHAMVGAAIGMILGTLATLATWNKDLGPHWYSLALVIEGIPCAWIGAKIWQTQSSK